MWRAVMMIYGERQEEGMRGSHHDFSKRTSAEHVVDLIVLLLVRRRRLVHYLLGHEREHGGVVNERGGEAPL